jgi:hypothetical protein
MYVYHIAQKPQVPCICLYALHSTICTTHNLDLIPHHLKYPLLVYTLRIHRIAKPNNKYQPPEARLSLPADHEQK